MNQRAHLFLLCIALALLVGCTAERRKARHLERGERYFAIEEFEKAKREYEGYLWIDASNPLPFQRLGLIWMEQGAPFRAASFLTKACELAPNDALNHTKFAAVLMTIGRFEEARRHLATVLDADPANEEALLLLADSNRTVQDAAETEARLQKCGQPESATTLMVAANLAVQQREFGSAEILLQRALAAAPKSPRAHLAMANYRLLRGDVAEAGTELKTAAELSPIRSDMRLRYADYLAHKVSEENARGVLQEITATVNRLLPGVVTARAAFVENEAVRSRRCRCSTTCCGSTRKTSRRTPSRWRHSSPKGETARAVAVAQDMDATYQNVPGIKYQLARAYLRNNDRASAEAALNQAIAAKPGFRRRDPLARRPQSSGGQCACRRRIDEAAARTTSRFCARRDAADGSVHVERRVRRGGCDCAAAG